MTGNDIKKCSIVEVFQDTATVEIEDIDGRIYSRKGPWRTMPSWEDFVGKATAWEDFSAQLLSWGEQMP